jgi:hypothetical protein
MLKKMGNERSTWENITKADSGETVCGNENLIQMARDGLKLQAIKKAVVNFTRVKSV